MKYRKKPVVIDAIQWRGRLSDIEPFLNEMDRNTVSVSPKGAILHIKTLEGTMDCPKGSWLIKGVKGEVYPCRNDIFKETYEKV